MVLLGQCLNLGPDCVVGPNRNHLVSMPIRIRDGRFRSLRSLRFVAHDGRNIRPSPWFKVVADIIPRDVVGKNKIWQIVVDSGNHNAILRM